MRTRQLRLRWRRHKHTHTEVFTTTTLLCSRIFQMFSLRHITFHLHLTAISIYLLSTCGRLAFSPSSQKKPKKKMMQRKKNVHKFSNETDCERVRLHWQWVHVVNMSAGAHSTPVIRHNYIAFNRWKLSDEECWQFAMSQDDTQRFPRKLITLKSINLKLLIMKSFESPLCVHTQTHRPKPSLCKLNRNLWVEILWTGWNGESFWCRSVAEITWIILQFAMSSQRVMRYRWSCFGYRIDLSVKIDSI